MSIRLKWLMSSRNESTVSALILFELKRNDILKNTICGLRPWPSPNRQRTNSNVWNNVSAFSIEWNEIAKDWMTKERGMCLWTISHKTHTHKHIAFTRIDILQPMRASRDVMMALRFTIQHQMHQLFLRHKYTWNDKSTKQLYFLFVLSPLSSLCLPLRHRIVSCTVYVNVTVVQCDFQLKPRTGKLIFFCRWRLG